MKDVLYVTSFSKKLYEATGKGIIDSFSLYQTESDILITYEGDIDLPDDARFIKHDLGTNTFLSNWIEENRDIIPIEYGGDIPSSQIKGLWNRRASLWFRKIVALREALRFKDDYKAIVFCDCDCLFLKKIPNSLILKTFKRKDENKNLRNSVSAKSSAPLDNDFFYHKGPHRDAIESGFMGFNLEKNGEQFIKLLVECFYSKDFRKYDRWDDGYVITQVLKETKGIFGIDLIDPALPANSHVVPLGPFASHIIHAKGIHTNIYGIFEGDPKDPYRHTGG